MSTNFSGANGATNDSDTVGAIHGRSDDSIDPSGDVLKSMKDSSGSYEMVLSGVVLGLLGLYLDRRFGTTPLLTVSLSVLGFAGATISLYYRYINRISELQAETKAGEAGLRSNSTNRQSDSSGASDDSGGQQ